MTSTHQLPLLLSEVIMYNILKHKGYKYIQVDWYHQYQLVRNGGQCH